MNLIYYLVPIVNLVMNNIKPNIIIKETISTFFIKIYFQNKNVKHKYKI